MGQTYTAVVEQSGGWRLGWIAESSGVNCQAESKEALLIRLQVTRQAALERNREEALLSPNEPT